MYIIVGLGNPDNEYVDTRHNVGRECLEYIAENRNFSDWQEDKKNKFLVSRGSIGKEKVILIEPQTYMNKSGLSMKGLISSKKKAEKLIVVYDDLDLPLGKLKVSFNKNSGGHRGVESIIKSLGTKSFIRIRIGISPQTFSGKLKKIKGEDNVKNFILGKFNKKEKGKIHNSFKSAENIIENIVSYGREKAISLSF